MRTKPLELDAEDWQLYSSTMCCDVAVADINTVVTDAINSSDSAREAAEKALPVFAKWEQYGAGDTEPMWVLGDVLAEAFGVAIIRWDWELGYPKDVTPKPRPLKVTSPDTVLALAEAVLTGEDPIEQIEELVQKEGSDAHKKAWLVIRAFLDKPH
jgi:hypothetical protein